jgi:hypothetical protein
VMQMIAQAIADAHKTKRKIGICKQALSNYRDFAAFLPRFTLSDSVKPDSNINWSHSRGARQQESDVIHAVCYRIVGNDGLLNLIGQSEFSMVPKRRDGAMNGHGPYPATDAWRADACSRINRSRQCQPKRNY